MNNLVLVTLLYGGEHPSGIIWLGFTLPFIIYIFQYEVVFSVDAGNPYLGNLNHETILGWCLVCHMYYGSWEAQLWFLARHTWHIIVKSVFKITNSIKFKSSLFSINNGPFLLYYLKYSAGFLIVGERGGRPASVLKNRTPGCTVSR